MELTLPLVIAIVGAGLIVGVASALFGVGGGVLMVPFMVIALDATQHLAEGTSLLVIVPTAIAGVAVHYKSGFVNLRYAAILGLGGMVGSFTGGTLAQKIEHASLQNLFAVFLIVMGVRVGIQGLRDRSASAGAPSHENG